MAIQNISGTDVMPKGVIDEAKNYTESVTTDKENKTQIEEIQEENKGMKIDTTA